MIESLVSAVLRRRLDAASIEEWLRAVLHSNDSKSLLAKSAYIGLLRIQGKMSVSEFASIDYDGVSVDSSLVS